MFILWLALHSTTINGRTIHWPLDVARGRYSPLLPPLSSSWVVAIDIVWIMNNEQDELPTKPLFSITLIPAGQLVHVCAQLCVTSDHCIHCESFLYSFLTLLCHCSNRMIDVLHSHSCCCWLMQMFFQNYSMFCCINSRTYYRYACQKLYFALNNENNWPFVFYYADLHFTFCCSTLTIDCSNSDYF